MQTGLQMHFSKGTIVIFGVDSMKLLKCASHKGKRVLLQVGLDFFPTWVACAVNVFVSSTFYCLSCIKEDSHPICQHPKCMKPFSLGTP